MILSLDWVDLGRRAALGRPLSAAKIIQVSLDHHIHNGWSMDYQALPPVDLFLSAEPDLVVPELVKAIGSGSQPRVAPTPARAGDRSRAGAASPTRSSPARCARCSATGRRRSPTCRSPGRSGWWPFRHPLDFLGSDGGGGVGAGPGIAVGAALALKDSGRLPVAHLRRRRLSDGRDRGLDGGALRHPAAVRGRQQSLVLQ